jgi:AraC-like DNA-binding protein
MAQKQIGTLRSAIPPGRSVVVTHSRIGRSDLMLHHHACFELITVHRRQGMERIVGEEAGAVKPGEAYLLAPFVPHSFHTDGFLPPGIQLDLTVLYFDARLVDPGTAPELQAIAPMLARARGGLRFPAAIGASFRALMLELERQKGAMAISALYALLEALRRVEGRAETLARHAIAAGSHEREHQLAAEICRYLRTACGDPLSLGQVARRFGIGRAALNALLRIHAKTTFLPYVSQLRIERAKKLLVSSRMAVTEVALEAGFGSLATFNRRFLDSEGVSPSVYRERAQP